MFTEEERRLNQSEGWDLFAYAAHGGLTYWDIQGIDCPEDADGEPLNPVFGADIEAYRYCKQRASEGSKRHQRAINAHGDYV